MLTTTKSNIESSERPLQCNKTLRLRTVKQKNELLVLVFLFLANTPSSREGALYRDESTKTTACWRELPRKKRLYDLITWVGKRKKRRKAARFLLSSQEGSDPPFSSRGI